MASSGRKRRRIVSEPAAAVAAAVVVEPPPFGTRLPPGLTKHIIGWNPRSMAGTSRAVTQEAHKPCPPSRRPMRDRRGPWCAHHPLLAPERVGGTWGLPCCLPLRIATLDDVHALARLGTEWSVHRVNHGIDQAIVTNDLLEVVTNPSVQSFWPTPGYREDDRTVWLAPVVIYSRNPDGLFEAQWPAESLTWLIASPDVPDLALLELINDDDRHSDSAVHQLVHGVIDEEGDVDPPPDPETLFRMAQSAKVHGRPVVEQRLRELAATANENLVEYEVLEAEDAEF